MPANASEQQPRPAQRRSGSGIQVVTGDVSVLWVNGAPRQPLVPANRDGTPPSRPYARHTRVGHRSCGEARAAQTLTAPAGSRGNRCLRPYWRHPARRSRSRATNALHKIPPVQWLPNLVAGIASVISLVVAVVVLIRDRVRRSRTEMSVELLKERIRAIELALRGAGTSADDLVRLTAESGRDIKDAHPLARAVRTSIFQAGASANEAWDSLSEWRFGQMISGSGRAERAGSDTTQRRSTAPVRHPTKPE